MLSDEQQAIHKSHHKRLSTPPNDSNNAVQKSIIHHVHPIIPNRAIVLHTSHIHNRWPPSTQKNPHPLDQPSLQTHHPNRRLHHRPRLQLSALHSSPAPTRHHRHPIPHLRSSRNRPLLTIAISQRHLHQQSIQLDWETTTPSRLPPRPRTRPSPTPSKCKTTIHPRPTLLRRNHSLGVHSLSPLTRSRPASS